MGMKLVVAIGGSSGSIYAQILLDKLAAMTADSLEAVGVVMSDNARFNWDYELGNQNWSQYPFKFYDKNDFMAPFASGSAKYGTMIVCPCSMGLLGRIATGVSNDLTTRAADVILKERRRLILVTRETPLSRIHIENMLRVHDAGGIICPAVPSFYHRPLTIAEAAATVVDRVLDLAGLPVATKRWSEE
jgi:4-hydroxy-3-polyprenylbenzoate decarboxylase